MAAKKKTYDVWTSNNPAEWEICHLATDDRDEAFEVAQRLYDSKRYRFIAIDKRDSWDRRPKTIWSNDPDTKVYSEHSII